VAAQLERARTQEIIKKNAEAERRRLHSFLMEAPAAIAILRGPSWSSSSPTTAVSRSSASAVVGLPEGGAAGVGRAGVWDLLDRVLATESPSSRPNLQRGRRERCSRARTRIFNWWQPTRDEQGHIDGVMIFAVRSPSSGGPTPSEQARATERELRRAAEEGNGPRTNSWPCSVTSWKSAGADRDRAAPQRLRGTDRTESNAPSSSGRSSTSPGWSTTAGCLRESRAGKLSSKKRAIEAVEAVGARSIANPS